jgi:hypothetical protein
MQSKDLEAGGEWEEKRGKSLREERGESNTSMDDSFRSAYI